MTSWNYRGTPLPKKTPTVVVGVGAGIAAYKVAFVVRAFRKAGWETHVIPTPRSAEFVGLETWRELSENPVDTAVFARDGAGHVQLARDADLIVLAPATANMLARMTAGIADDLLTATVLASPAPVLACPAMHTQMWRAPATQSNVATLRDRGWNILEPASGPLSSGDTGEGRLPDPDDIFAEAVRLAEAKGIVPESKTQDVLGAATPVREVAAESSMLPGTNVLITAGGTREPLDPVRFLGNNSTGTQGIALAEAALAAGANVTLIVSNISASLPEPSDALTVVSAPSAQELLEAVTSRLVNTDVLVMAAAVADFRPKSIADQKIKKSENEDDGMTLTLERTPDILATVAKSAERPAVLIGFGAETGDEYQVLDLGAAKAIRKGADILAVNRVGADTGFGDVDNALTYFDAAGKIVGSSSGTKIEVATDLIERAAQLLAEDARKATDQE